MPRWTHLLLFAALANPQPLGAVGDYFPFPRKLVFKDLWKLYRFAVQQKTWVKYIDPMYKNHFIEGVATLKDWSWTSHSRDIARLQLNHHPTGKSLNLWIDRRINPALYQFAMGLPRETTLYFEGQLLGHSATDHLRFTVAPTFLVIYAPPRRDSFKANFYDR